MWHLGHTPSPASLLVLESSRTPAGVAILPS